MSFQSVYPHRSERIGIFESKKQETGTSKTAAKRMRKKQKQAMARILHEAIPKATLKVLRSFFGVCGFSPIGWLDPFILPQTLSLDGWFDSVSGCCAVFLQLASCQCFVPGFMVIHVS